MAIFKAGDKVEVNSPMDHHHGRKGVVETVSGFDGSSAVRFDDNARAYYPVSALKKLDNFFDFTDVLAGPNKEEAGLLIAALQELMGSVSKSAPTSSDVHVPTAGEEKLKKAKTHDTKNLEDLKTSLSALVAEFNRFIGEEENEQVDKDKLTAEGRKHIAPENFALSGDRYPIHDLSHARNALARSSGKPEESQVREAVYTKYPALKKGVTDVDSDLSMYPGIDNLEAGILKAVMTEWGTFGPTFEAADETGDNDSYADAYGMQKLVEGMDYETEHNELDETSSKEAAQANLETDPNHYRKLMMEQNSTDDVLAKDTEQTEDDPYANEGFNLDLGSGQARKAGAIGIDTYPYDHGTMVHDLNLGIPFPDSSVSKLQCSNCLEEMEDPKALLSEIHRVMMPGGEFVYEGPNEVYNQPSWAQDYPGLVLTDHEDNHDSISKEDVQEHPIYRQKFTRVVIPDPATANDAEPRVGLSQYDQLPADALIAADALGYSWSDSTSSGRGNLMHGYASQGALLKACDEVRQSYGCTEKAASPQVDQMFYDTFGSLMKNSMNDAPEKQKSIEEQQVAAAFEHKPVNPLPPRRPKRGSVKKMLKKGKIVPILKADKMKQIVYGVVLAPNEIDYQDDFMNPEEIEKAAHTYLSQSRVVGSGHEKPIEAEPVESFIAPQDFDITGQYGPQPVKKGSWVLGVKIHDPEEWKKVLSGEYTGFSVGGYGERNEM